LGVGLVLIADKKELAYPRLERTISRMRNVKAFFGLPRKDVIAAFKAADLFVCGSEYETASLVTLEAMHSGTPWVSTDVGNIRELKGGKIVPLNKFVAEAPKIILNLLENENERNRLKKDAIEQAQSRFSWEKILPQYKIIFELL
jgi:L-malate glycosyltransferase